MVALRCQKPERIRELLHKAVDALAADSRRSRPSSCKLVECKDLDGFEELSASMLALVGKRPVIGFHDGWMIIGSEPKAVERVLDTWSGKSPGIDQSAQFQRFGLKIDGPVRSVGYNDVAENIRNAAQSLDKAGAVASMFVGMAAAKVDKDHPNPQLETANELLKLVPSVAKVVGKFDFLEGRLQVTQQGDDPHTYIQRSVTLVRPPAEGKRIAGAVAAGTPMALNRSQLELSRQSGWTDGSARNGPTPDWLRPVRPTPWLIVKPARIDYPFVQANPVCRCLSRERLLRSSPLPI